MYVFTMPAERWDETNPDRQAVLQLVLKHRAVAAHLHKLKEYYLGHHDILGDKDRDLKLVCNYAKDIQKTAELYFIGNPISYKSADSDLKTLTDELDNAGADEADGDNGLDLSVYGRAYEYIYTQEDDTALEIKNLCAENTFMVYDDTIQQRELFGVYYYVRKDDTDMSGKIHYIATVMTANYVWVFELSEIPSENSVLDGPAAHFKGEVPLIEYLNNKDGIGDFELQTGLIDAYNALMSDRVVDKEQFIDAILVIYGTLLSDEDDEEGDGKGSDRAMRRLKMKKLLEMPDASKAEYLTRTFDESGVEILKKAIEQDIHKFSHIPCMTDEAFGGNVSGVAMEFKLLGMENITKIKTRYYRKGLRKRLRIFCNWLETSSKGKVDPASVTAVFTRAMPKNLLEISQYVANLKGTVSLKTLLSEIPFVDDPDEEIKAVEEENQKAAELQQKIFGGPGIDNTPPEGNEPDANDIDDGDEDGREKPPARGRGIPDE